MIGKNRGTHMSNDHTFFVKLNNSHKVRKSALEFSKSLISLLKRFENLQKIRQQKKQKINELSNTLNEITRITAPLDFDVPDLSIETGVKPEQKENKKDNEDSKETDSEKGQAQETGYDDELKKIEESAADIEKKINELL